MQAQSLHATKSTGVAGGSVFSKEAAALLAGPTTVQANALEGVSQAMMFR